jgi:FKBP12-rapamycin complex-associated protein
MISNLFFQAFVHDPLINWRLFNFNEVPQVSNFGNAHTHTVVSSEEAAPNDELMQPPRGAREKELLQVASSIHALLYHTFMTTSP